MFCTISLVCWVIETICSNNLLMLTSQVSGVGCTARASQPVKDVKRIGKKVCGETDLIDNNEKEKIEKHLSLLETFQCAKSTLARLTGQDCQGKDHSKSLHGCQNSKVCLWKKGETFKLGLVNEVRVRKR